jgi:hypothetical protein
MVEGSSTITIPGELNSFKSKGERSAKNNVRASSDAVLESKYNSFSRVPVNS